MNRMLLRKYVGDSALLFSACATALFAFAWVRVWIVSLLDMSRFRTVMEQFREYEHFSPIPFDQLLTYEGRIGMTFDEPVVLLCVVTWCVARGSDVVSGELGRGTLEMLVTQPLSRIRLMVAHASVTIAGLALLTLILWAGVAVGVHTTHVTEQPPPPTLKIPLVEIEIQIPWGAPEPVVVPMSERVDPAIFGASVFSLFAFGFFLLALSTLVSSIDRYRWRTVGIVIGFYVVQLFMFGLGKASQSLDWLLTMSFFNYYRPQEAAQRVINPALGSPWSLVQWHEDGWALGLLAYTTVLLVLGAAMYLMAGRIFTRRDLPAPL